MLKGQPFQKSEFQISDKMVKPIGCTKQCHPLLLPMPYCVFNFGNNTYRHNFTNIFQTESEHISFVKLSMGNKKNLSFLLVSRSEKA